MWRRSDRTVERPEPVTIMVDGAEIAAYPGESAATALLAAGYTVLRHSPRNGEARGPFCLMGVCQECLVRINGRAALACGTPVRAGLTIETGDRN